MSKNSKTGIILGVIALIVVLLSFLLTNVDGGGANSGSTDAASVQEIITNAQNEANAVADSERKELIEIDVDDYLDIYSGSSRKLVMLGSSQCGYCAIAQPIIENLAYKYSIDIYYLNAALFSGDDESKFINSDEYFSSGFGTPVLMYIGNDSIIDMVDGLTDTNHYVEFLNKNEIISE